MSMPIKWICQEILRFSCTGGEWSFSYIDDDVEDSYELDLRVNPNQ